MTYFGFLLRFLVIPILLLLAVMLWRAKTTGEASTRPLWAATVIHIGLALLYTTPWDNYLVATGVWYYNPRLVSGILLWYVPLEEYTFFVLQTIFVSLWLWLVSRWTAPQGGFRPSGRLRLWTCAALALLWVLSAAVFFSGWKPGTYLSILLFWALPPLIVQSAFGADILWQYRRQLAAVILPLGLYLSFTDSLAIAASTWTIDPAQTTGLMLGSLPVEEAIFFFTTVILTAFGVTLLLAPESRRRLRAGQDRAGESQAGSSLPTSVS